MSSAPMVCTRSLVSFKYSNTLCSFASSCSVLHITWRQRHNYKLVSSCCDYILSTDYKYFKDVSISNPRLFALANYGQHHQGSASLTLIRDANYPSSPQNRGSLTQADALFNVLIATLEQPMRDQIHARRSWVSGKTWVGLSQPTCCNQVCYMQVSKPIDQDLKADPWCGD
jgi:hypothetical protein